MRLLALTAAAAAMLMAGCGGASPSASLAQPTVAVSPHAAASTVPPPSASPAAPQRLTVRQARAAYLRIVDPSNRIAGAVNTDLADSVPFAQLRADELAYAASVAKVDRQFRAIRWPARVQGYITSMTLTYDPAVIRCARAQAAAGSDSAASNVFSTNQQCIASQNPSLPQEVRVLLRLPPMTGG